MWVCLLVQVYAASALMEWHHGDKNDKVPRNIFELGLKAFLGGDSGFVLAYADFLLGVGDPENMRQLFERAIAATSAPEALQRLWDRFIQVRAFRACSLMQAHPWIALSHTNSMSPTSIVSKPQYTSSGFTSWG